MVVSNYCVNDIVVITSLQSRPELAGSRCRVLGFDAEGGRYSVSLVDTGEAIHVRLDALQRAPQASDWLLRWSMALQHSAFTDLGGGLSLTHRCRHRSITC